MSEQLSRNSFDQLCDEFEAAWKAEERPNLTQYLERVEAKRRGNLLRELLQVELWWRRTDISSPTVDKYKLQFPGLEHFVDDAFSSLLKNSL